MSVINSLNNAADTLKLSNGYEIPCVGFGTWQAKDRDTAVNAVIEAVNAGYRHLDCASHYHNEDLIGEALKLSGIKREDIFVTSKVWNTERGYDMTMQSFEQTCSDLDLDYLDLFLVHWPASEHLYPDTWEEINIDTWQALIDLYNAGRVKSIGVSNFMPHHFEALMKTAVKPMVNQIEFHPGLMWQETLDYCRENDIIVEAWSPLGTGDLLSNKTLMEIAGKYGISTAQLCLRWIIQHGVIPLPKSVTPSRIKENISIFDFQISEEDMKTIDEMEYFGGSGLHPDKIDF